MSTASKKKISKKVIFKILASVVLIGSISAYYLISRNNEGEVLSWMSSSWAYRKGVEVGNAGGTQLTNENVLITLDTSSLVTAGKMQNDCDDLRATDSDTTTAIDYWIESGCNTSSTRIWVRIPTLPAAGTTVYLYYGNSSASNAEKRWPIYLSFGDGADGDITVSANTNINTTNKISGRSCADGGDAVNYNITAFGGTTATTATLSATPSSGCLSSGDEVLLINLQGTSSAYTNVGNYEIMVIDSISTNTVTFTTLKTKYYGSGSSNDSNIGTTTSTQRVMLQRVPNYNDVTISSGYNFYPSAWNGTKGGVMMFKANGTVTVTGTIHANALGYRGGSGGASGNSGQGYGGESLSGNPGGGNGGAYVSAGSAGVTGGGGGGGSGGSTGSNAGGSGGVGGAGGGGGDGSGASAARGGGGGGAGYGAYGYGGEGGNNGGTNTSGAGKAGGGSVGGAGGGGGTYGSTAITNLYLGSGGAGGGDGCGTGPAGGAGGGAILIYAKTLSVSGVISSNGANGNNGGGDTSFGCGGAGGGSGGAVKIYTDTATLGTTLVRAYAGSAGTGPSYDGGAGGVGRIRAEYITSLSGTTSPTASTQQLSLQSTTVQAEEAYNQTPTSPTSLQTESSSNPQTVTDTTPEFSAIFNDPDTSDTSNYYQIQVNTNSSFTGTVMWDSNKTSMTSTSNGSRSPQISYAGTTLTLNGSTYYWRIKFWDVGGLESPWSSTANFKLDTIPTAPTSLYTEGSANPTKVTDLTPGFSAIFNDPDTGDTSNYYQIQVNTNSSFTGTVMWNSNKTSMTSTNQGSRSPDLSYAGTSLSSNGTTYFWRIKFWDNSDVEGTWSETASFIMSGSPTASALLVDNTTNPIILSSASPVFSAVYTDPNGDDCSAYEINANTTNTFNGTELWNTGKISITITSGSRSADITYHGTPLTNSENIYYWRIRFWDSDDNAGEWSSTAQFTDFYPSFKFEGLGLEGIQIN